MIGSLILPHCLRAQNHSTVNVAHSELLLRCSQISSVVVRMHNYKNSSFKNCISIVVISILSDFLFLHGYIATSWSVQVD